MAFRHAAAAALLAGSVAAALPAAAAPSAERRPVRDARSVEEARRAVEASSTQMTQAAAALERSEERLAVAVTEANRAGAALERARERHARAVAEERAAAAAEAEARRQLADTEARIRQHERTAGAVARTAYQRGPVSELVLVLEADTPGDLLARITAVETVLRGQGKAIDALAEVRAELTRQRLALAQALVRKEAARETAKKELRQVRALERRAQAARERASRSAADRRAALTAAKAQLAQDERRYAELIGEARKLQTTLRGRTSAARARRSAPDTSNASANSLLMPVQGRVTSPFGMRRHPITGVYKLHTGQDIAAPCGTPVRAALGGTVLSAGYNRAYGYRSVITHGRVRGVELTTTYNHQSSLGVSAGQRVGTGEIIGRVGTTGYSTGCHLHFEVLENGEFVNPTRWL